MTILLTKVYLVEDYVSYVVVALFLVAAIVFVAWTIFSNYYLTKKNKFLLNELKFFRFEKKEHGKRISKQGDRLVWLDIKLMESEHYRKNAEENLNASKFIAELMTKKVDELEKEKMHLIASLRTSKGNYTRLKTKYKVLLGIKEETEEELPQFWYCPYKNREQFDIMNEFKEKNWRFIRPNGFFGYTNIDDLNNFCTKNDVMERDLPKISFNQFERYMQKENERKQR